MNQPSLTIRITFDTDDADDAYLIAKSLVSDLEDAEAIDSVLVLSGVADED
jgi:hypothetical protein